MGLIKRYRIQEKGGITLIEKPVQTYSEPKYKDEEETLEENEEIETEAENRAHEIIKEAQETSESIKRKARDEGISSARQKAQETVKEALDMLNQAVNERKNIIKDAEPEILRLALKASEQIIRSEVSLHRDVCLNIVSDAINRVSDREQVIVRVNKEDADYIKKYKDRLSGILDGVKSFSILEDSQIEPGGCVIETNLGYVDARISTKLQSLEDALKKVSLESESR